MGVLSTFMTACRTNLAASHASLSALPEGVSIDDPPDTDKTWFAVSMEPASSLGAEHGGGSLITYVRNLIVQVAWMRDLDDEAHANTRADDYENIDAVMLKDSNKTSGIVLVNKASESETNHPNWTRAELRYSVRFRVAQNLT